MGQKVTITIIGVLLSLSLALSLTAQQAEQAGEKYKNRYTKDLFEEADTNHDGFVDWNEARSVSLAIEKDRYGQKRFNAADLNNDGRLSIEEARKYKGFEIRHRDDAAAKSQRLKDATGAGQDTGERMTKKEAVQVKQPYQKEKIRDKKLNTRKRDRNKSGTETDR